MTDPTPQEGAPERRAELREAAVAFRDFTNAQSEWEFDRVHNEFMGLVTHAPTIIELIDNLTAMQQERDAVVEDRNVWRYLANAKNDALVEALQERDGLKRLAKFAWHKQDCNSVSPYDALVRYVLRRCDCGYDAARAATEKAKALS